MKTRITTIIWAAVAACGCLDLELLDNMDQLDSGDTESAADTDADGDADGDSDGDADGPPATDSGDELPPSLISLSCGAGEIAQGAFCVAVGPVSASVRFATDEPASVAIDVAEETVSAGVLSDAWSQEHHLALTGLVPGSPTDVAISFSDVNDNADSDTLQVTTTGGTPVAVTEVLADPLGAEPAQEFVEIVNLGLEQIDISGWMIDDNGDIDGDPIPDGTFLGASQVGLLVSPDYDCASAEDPAPDPGALVIYLGSSIASSGLKNSEAESVELYDDLGDLVSCYQGQVGDPQEGRSAVRLAAELPDGDARAWELDPGGD